jgi:hypothetical protein
MDTNEVIIISEEADGTTTIVDIVQTNVDANVTEDSGSTVLEVLEAILDSDDEVTETNEESVEIADGVFVPATPQESTEEAFIPQSESVVAEFTASEFAAGGGGYIAPDGLTDEAGVVEFAPVVAADAGSVIADYGDSTAAASDATTGESSEADAQAQANIAAASEAQAQADEAIEAGDFETAAQLRGDAEEYAYAAGDDSMLHGSDSSDLSLADQQFDLADMKEQEAAEHTAAGDYDAARDATADAATYQQWADGNAGSTVDHSEQTENQQAQLEWADWHQDIADGNQDSADAYAASGDLDTAAIYQESANDEQTVADEYGAASVYEATQDTSDGTYDASSSAIDTAYDSSYSATDTSYDSSYSATDTTSYDSE